jgi:hypothetical protein
MKDAKFQFVFSEMGISVSQIESLLGYDEKGDREFIQLMIEEVLGEAGKLCNIKAEYRIYDEISMYNTDKSLTINNIHFNIKEAAFSQLEKIESVAVFACTAGEGIGKKTRELMMDGDPLEGYIFDVVGSALVDAAASLMKDKLAETVKISGKKITNRYYPGYCGWNVDEQHKLFKLLPDNFCGIRLTDSALMDPVKSVSGIIGIGEHVKYIRDTCSYCERTDCPHRNIIDVIEKLK